MDNTATFERQLGATQAVRKLLSTKGNPPVDEVINIGIIPYLCEFLKKSDKPLLQFEAAWALTNIGSSDKTYELVNAGLIPLLVPLLQSPTPDVREQASWCLGNIAGDNTNYRDNILETKDSVRLLLLNVTQAANISMLRNVVWAISNLCRGKPCPNWHQVQEIVPVIANVVKECQDEETLTDACWALSYLSDGPNERIEALTSVGICDYLVTRLQVMLSRNEQDGTQDKAITPTLRTLGNIVTGNDKQTQAALDSGFLRELVRLMNFPKAAVQKEACWAASNVTAGTAAQIGTFLAMPNLPERVVELLTSAEWIIKKEAAWTVSNICTGGKPEHISCLVERFSVIMPLCKLLEIDDTKFLLLIMSTLESILKVDPEKYSEMIEECGGMDEIEKLQEHANVDVYNKSVNLLEMYFGAEEEGDEENNPLAPNVANTGNAFTFGDFNNPTKESNMTETSQQPFSFTSESPFN